MATYIYFGTFYLAKYNYWKRKHIPPVFTFFFIKRKGILIPKKVGKNINWGYF